MDTKTKTAGFGSKGEGDRPMTFAETLLSGRPFQRDSSCEAPHLKPRPKKNRFGSKGQSQRLQIFGTKPEALV